MDNAKLTRAMGRTRSALSSEARVHLEGDGRMVIEGQKGIVEYTEETLRVRTVSVLLTISGRGLYLERLSEEEAVICGTIENIALKRLEGSACGR